MIITDVFKKGKKKIHTIKNAILHSTYLMNKSYLKWIEENEPSKKELLQQEEISNKFEYKPLISIITPVYKIKPEILDATIKSVLNQTFKNWELCIVNGDCENQAIIELLLCYAQKDKRIKLKLLDENLGISGNSNEALSIATGEFIALLDHDDLLAPFALFEVVQFINESPLDFIYSDRDLVTEDGKRRFNPLFKPDWSPELLLSANYLIHLAVIRKRIIDKVGGFVSEMDGAQDWDLFFRIIENTDKIGHIPKILYHWRSCSTSCAEQGVNAKPYIFEAQSHAISAHLKRVGPEAKLTYNKSGLMHVKFEKETSNKISIIIASCNIESLKRCIQSISQKTDYDNYELIIINTGLDESKDEIFFKYISTSDKIQLIHYNSSINYAAMNNIGASFANGDCLLFLNEDIEIINPDWLSEMVGWIRYDPIGVVGAKILYPDRRIQHAGVILGLGGFAGYIFAGIRTSFLGIFGSQDWYRDYLAVTSACMIVKTGLFKKIGGFNEEFLFYGSDVEFCLRIWKKGYRILYNPFACIIHHESITRRDKIPKEDFIACRKYYDEFLVHGDPYYNRNLSFWDNNPKIKRKSEEEAIKFVQEQVNNE